MVAGRAVVRDLFPPAEAARIFSSIILVMGAAPIIAPSLGGFVVTRWGWRPIFAVLTVIGLALFAAVALWLPESRQPDRSVSLRLGPILRGFGRVLKQPSFSIYGTAGGLSGAGMFAYISGASFVFMELFGLPASAFALVFGLNAAGLVAGSQINRWLLKRFDLSGVTLRASALQATAALLLAAGALIGLADRVVVQALLFLYLFLHGFLNPDTTALAMAPFTKEAGSAAAVLGCLQMLVAALASAAVSTLANGTALPMAAVMAVCSIVGLGLMTAFALRRRSASRGLAR
jgi:DHA1 family bicyclomycin/chloramphenicol resistance-like MFS transporter